MGGCEKLDKLFRLSKPVLVGIGFFFRAYGAHCRGVPSMTLISICSSFRGLPSMTLISICSSFRGIFSSIQFSAVRPSAFAPMPRHRRACSKSVVATAWFFAAPGPSLRACRTSFC